MLKATSRQIKTYQERYGNFDNDVRSPYAADVVDYTDIAGAAQTETARSDFDSILITDRSQVQEPMFTPVEELTQDRQPLYSTLSGTKGVPQAAVLPKRKSEEKKARNKEDFMPSMKTQAYAKEKAEEHTEKPQAAYREQSRLTPRMKMLLLVYVAIAVVLAVAVIATGVSISSASAQAQSFAEDIVQKQEIISEQETRIAVLTNESTIRDSAVSAGMVKAGNADVIVDRVDKVKYPVPDPHTNGFDRFCDGLSRI